MGNDEATCYVGGLSNDVTEDIIEELFVQVGPIKQFSLKKADTHNYALVEFEDEETVPFAIEIMDGVLLYNRPISVKPRNNTKQEEAWKKAQSERRRSDTRDTRNGQQYLPQTESRKRDHNGHSVTSQSSRDFQDFRSPLPPPPPAPLLNMSSYFTPPPPPPVMGYAPSPSTDKRDKWHTPPSHDHVNPKIPIEYDTPRRDGRSRDRGHYHSGQRDDYRGDRRDGYRDDRRDGYRDDRGSYRRSDSGHRRY